MLTGGSAPAATDPPDPQLACPEIEGFGPAYEPTAWYSVREGMVFIFGSTVRFSSLSNAECTYSEPTVESSPVGWATIEVFWASPVTIEEHRARPCLLTETERDGVGVVTAGGTASAYATYAVSADEPVDTAPFVAGARELLDQVVPLASSCEGVAPPTEPTSDLPTWLAAAFDDTAPPEPDPTDADPSEPSSETSTTDASTTEPDDVGTTPATTEPGGPAVDDPDEGAAPEAAPIGDADDGASGSGWLGVVGIVATILSVVALGLTFVLVRRETRIHPALDVARVLVLAAVAIGGTWLLSDAASPLAVIVAVSAGFALGVWQGSRLAVRAVADGWTARRTGWAVIAFAVGLVVTQVAARLDYVAGQGFGLATTFLAAALAAGVIVGRRPRVVEARRVAGVASIVLVALASGAGPNDDHARAAVPDDDRDDALATLVDLVDWSNVEVRGGLFASEGKPPVEATVPPAFGAVPDPVTASLAWSHDNGARTVAYTVDETYTFGLRTDGNCCTVEYTGIGTATEADGTVATYEAAGRLDDIQSVALEGSPTSSLSSDVAGLPFGEVQAFLPSGATLEAAVAADPATCGRPVAEQRSSYDLEETGGVGSLTTYRVDGTDLGTPRDLTRVAITTDCDVPGFTPADALAIAPAPPPPTDPVRDGGCPVRQEVLAALVPANQLPGVDTTTTANAFLAPNAAACADMVQLGQGGPGGTRHELMYEFARPTDPAFGDGASLVDEIRWTDLPLATDFLAGTACGVDAEGRATEPGDPDQGCQQVDRYELGDVRVFVWTDWHTEDGPNVLVFVTAPWGSYSYRCHHCTPNDPTIGTFLDTVNQLGADAAEQIAEVATSGTPDTAGASDTADTPGDGVDDPSEPVADVGEASEPVAGTGDATEQADSGATDGSAAPADESSSDDSEPAAVAALLGLGGAAAMLGLALGEAGGWRVSDPTGAGASDGGEPAAGSEALGVLNNIQGFDQALAEYQALGYDPAIAAVLAGLEVHGGSAAGDAAPFGGIGDSRLEQLGQALLPEGIRHALIPSDVVKNNIRTTLQAFDAFTNSLGDSWYQGALDLSAFDHFGEQLDARPGLDPFAGYDQAMELLFDELYTDGGRGLVADAMNIATGWYLGDHAALVEDASRVTMTDVVDALNESADEFRNEVASGAHGPVLQGLDSVFEITAEVTTDPVHAIGEFVDDLANIVEHGVGDGYWTEVGEQVDSTLRNTPVVSTIYNGYHEVFSGIASHAESVEDLQSGAAAVEFAAEMAEGAAALGAELIDFVQGTDHATQAFDYLRSLF